MQPGSLESVALFPLEFLGISKQIVGNKAFQFFVSCVLCTALLLLLNLFFIALDELHQRSIPLHGAFILWRPFDPLCILRMQSGSLENVALFPLEFLGISKQIVGNKAFQSSVSCVLRTALPLFLNLFFIALVESTKEAYHCMELYSSVIVRPFKFSVSYGTQTNDVRSTRE